MTSRSRQLSIQGDACPGCWALAGDAVCATVTAAPCSFCLPPCLQASASWCSITELSTTLFLVLEIIFRHSMHGFLHFTCEGERQHGSVTAQAGNSQQTIALTFFFLLAELMISLSQKALLHVLAAETPDWRHCACDWLDGACRILSSF